MEAVSEPMEAEPMEAAGEPMDAEPMEAAAAEPVDSEDEMCECGHSMKHHGCGKCRHALKGCGQCRTRADRHRLNYQRTPGLNHIVFTD
eukprot:12399815-Karenia_brevis.AAC.1